MASQNYYFTCLDHNLKNKLIEGIAFKSIVMQCLSKFVLVITLFKSETASKIKIFLVVVG